MRFTVTRCSAVRCAWFVIALCISPILLSCVRDADPAPADEMALRQVRQRFGQRVALGLETPPYVRARIRPGATLTEADIDSIYHAFFFPSGERRETRYVYLNVYRPDGGFLVQLAYDPGRAEIIRSRTEYYE